MGTDLFYPDNRNRANRVQELYDDSVGMQHSAIQSNDQMIAADKRMGDLLANIMAAKNLKNVDELIAEMYRVLPPEQGEKVKALLEQIASTDLAIENGETVISMIFLISAGGASLAKIAAMCASQGLYTGFRMTARAVARFFSGAEFARDEAAELLKAARVFSRGLEQEFTTGTRLGRSLRCVKVLGEALSVAALALEAVFLVIAAIEGAEQRKELQEKIKECFKTRVQFAYLQDLISAAMSFQGQLESILVLESSQLDESTKQAAIQSISDSIGTGIVRHDETVTFASVAATWTKMDGNRKSWTDEDPALDSVVADLEAENADD